MSKQSYHNPQGDPCAYCGLPFLQHRVDHIPIGNPCEKCGLPKHKHRKKEDDRTYRDRIGYIGIDGEGQGRKNHRYILLAASNENGDRKWYIRAREGDTLSTLECLEFITSLPAKRNKLFSYSFNYDLTKILTDLPDELLYLLFRPHLRSYKDKDKTKGGPLPIIWKGFEINLQGTKFSVRKGKRGRLIVIWDLFKFFQSKFVSALETWKVGVPALWDRMSQMKNKRNEFDKESFESILAYCFEETTCIAQLAKKLIESHKTAKLKLTTFYGAGSSGAAMLNAMGIKNKIRLPPDEMKEAIACAFSGGRFENRIIGMVPDVVYNRDIASAYPYHLTFLPCLLHGAWRLTKTRKDLDSPNTRAALVHYALGISNISTWGPFPFRTSDGSISFPIESGGGWVWKEEYLSGERLFDHVQFREAWIYECDCDCQPFAEIPRYYVLRLNLGKEGPGIVIKLGCNSCYGKLAQSVGNAIFNCWVWAGMITSGTRAQFLDILGLHQDWANCLGVATDGIFSTERIKLPVPKDTGTKHVYVDGKLKPELGSWEEKIYNKGMFFARPGIYFPLNPTKDDIKDVRARGVGKSIILDQWRRIVDCWEKDGVHGLATVSEVSRFCGAKTSIHYSKGKGFNRANAKDGIKPAYGQWIKRPIEMSFNPMPKREGLAEDGRSLIVRRFPRSLESIPYSRAMLSREAADLKIHTDEILEQPDADFCEYDLNGLSVIDFSNE